MPPFARTILLAALAVPAAAQPHIHDFDFYGLQRGSPEKILETLKLHTGDPLPGSRGDLEDRIEKISGIVQARVEAVCCEGKDISLFIGVQEKGATPVAFRSEPGGDATLPDALTGTYDRFRSSSQATRDSGIFADQFAEFAKDHLTELSQVVRTAGEAQQRAIAAAVLQYAPSTQSVIDDLQYTLQDPDESVRANALRSLRAMAVQATRPPSAGLKISPTWLIELVNSIVLNDRVQATETLLMLTDHGERQVLDQIQVRDLPALAEMARWENLRYALPPFLLLARIAGLTDQEAQRRWSEGEREPVIAKALGRQPAARQKR